MFEKYNIENQHDYLRWRNDKLKDYPITTENLFTNILDPANPAPQEISQIDKCCQKFNLSFYRFMQNTDVHKTEVHLLGSHLGLTQLDQNICADDDKLTSIEARENKGQHTYIPYTRRKLSWHTDGYYNTPETQIHGMLLHCVRPAVTGGDNFFLDHEIAYILLRDENPEFITALCQPDAMTIPANILKGEIIRAEQTGPVFSVLPNEQLHMRYSARLRNIKWKANALPAADFLQSLWQQESPYIIEATLKSGEGVLCNNVLHCRTEFEDSESNGRLLYRGRYYDRVSATA